MTDNTFGVGDCEEDSLIDYDLAKYCTVEEANYSLNMSSTNNLTILYINIKSLYFNDDDFNSLLTNFDKKPDIIAFSETKITEKSHTNYHPFLDGYKYHGVKSKTHFGSVGFFTRNNFVPTRRHDLNCSEKGLFEMIWFDVFSGGNNSAKTTIGVVYRHCGRTDIPSFTRRLGNIVSKLNREHANYFILGDYNADLLKIDEFYQISDFVNNMHSLNAVNLVNIPTRFPIGNQVGSPSILDHFWTNQPTRVINIELIVNPIRTTDQRFLF